MLIQQDYDGNTPDRNLARDLIPPIENTKTLGPFNSIQQLSSVNMNSSSSVGALNPINPIVTSFDDIPGNQKSERPDHKTTKMSDLTHPYITFQSWAANHDVGPSTANSANDNQRMVKSIEPVG